MKGELEETCQLTTTSSKALQPSKKSKRSPLYPCSWLLLSEAAAVERVQESLRTTTTTIVQHLLTVSISEQVKTKLMVDLLVASRTNVLIVSSSSTKTGRSAMLKNFTHRKQEDYYKLLQCKTEEVNMLKYTSLPDLDDKSLSTNRLNEEKQPLRLPPSPQQSNKSITSDFLAVHGLMEYSTFMGFILKDLEYQ